MSNYKDLENVGKLALKNNNLRYYKNYNKKFDNTINNNNYLAKSFDKDVSMNQLKNNALVKDIRNNKKHIME